MSDTMTGLHGRFIWYETMTTDSKAAEAFYRNVVGWGARDAGMPNMAYTLLTVEDVPVAGMMTMPESALSAGARPGWIGHVAVDDVDGTAARFERDGGTTHHAPEDIPGVGRFAVVADPHGAVIALFKASPDSKMPPPPAPGTPGTPGWRELHAGDREADFAFYSSVFGWTKGDAIDMGPVGVYQLLAKDGETFGGMMTKTEDTPKPFWLYYFNVDGIDAAVLRVQKGGGQVLNGPMQVPGGSWIVQCLDPQGGMFALVAPQR
jgi:predicted enzyme related to lactoylglutathione lyase